MHHNTALQTGVALKKVILNCFQYEIREQTDKIDLMGKSDSETIDIITRAERTVEKLDNAMKS